LYDLVLLVHVIKEVMNMKRIFIVVFLIVSLLSSQNTVDAAEEKAVFVRKDGLWLKSDGNERKLVEGSKISHPSFSYDGRLISYLSGDQKELWVYNTVTRLKRRVFVEGASLPKWSPVDPFLAWKSDGVLDVIDVMDPSSSFKNVILGVGNYSWTPDGKGFIVSSEANLEPDGWSPIKLFEVPRDANGDMKKAKLLTTLPEESAEFFAVGTTGFKWSAGENEFAFIACPTASLSADSNYLMAVSKDGKRTRQVAEMLSNQNWFHWSPKSEELGFIKGIGRLASENKVLTVWDSETGKEKDYGAASFADGDFTWRDNSRIIVSRQKEWGWDVPVEQRSKPFLVGVDINNETTKKLIEPPRGSGDVYPKSLIGGGVAWVRTSEEKSDLMIKKSDQSKEEVWIKDVKPPTGCSGWNCVLEVYKAR
jgi:hypothetical protein